MPCHGEDGNGVVPGARNFGDLDYMRGETPASFYTAVTEGRGEMQGFLDTLTSDELWDVVFYVWRFSTDAEKLALDRIALSGGVFQNALLVDLCHQLAGDKVRLFTHRDFSPNDECVPFGQVALAYLDEHMVDDRIG